ncbi:hypothetical protein DBV15_09604 [Temnothorax longispinosus]|uniref:Uncharacterized protein n=1 Tax=Temnothorax longispinosus TaxID=300112 RepID=A0A4S2KXH6_9HYME|nr:hypothetical protein DBV15_09604 [Temnothorax longispinosus]
MKEHGMMSEACPVEIIVGWCISVLTSARASQLLLSFSCARFIACFEGKSLAREQAGANTASSCRIGTLRVVENSVARVSAGHSTGPGWRSRDCSGEGNGASCCTAMHRIRIRIASVQHPLSARACNVRIHGIMQM